MVSSFLTWLALKVTIGKNLTDWVFKYALRNKPQSVKEKYKDGQLVEKETIYR